MEYNYGMQASNPPTHPPHSAPSAAAGADADASVAGGTDKREFSAGEIRQLAQLARLEVADHEIPAAAKALGDIIAMIALMEQANPQQAQELTHVASQTRMREDQAVTPRNRDALMANAPQAENGFFLAPKVVE